MDNSSHRTDRQKAISVRQPWAWLIVNGFKDIENRTWPTSYQGPVLIHASQKMTLYEYHQAAQLASSVGIEIPEPKDLERGGIVGEAVITDCVLESDSPWFVGPWGFVLSNAKPLPFQPYKGRLGVFNFVLDQVA